VAAAREAVIAGLPAFAVSIVAVDWTEFSYAAGLSRKIACHYLSGGLPNDLFLNINVPGAAEEEIQGVRMTRQAPSRFREFFQREEGGKNPDYLLKGDFIVLSEDELKRDQNYQDT